jgi:hypothetical protein
MAMEKSCMKDFSSLDLARAATPDSQQKLVANQVFCGTCGQEADTTVEGNAKESRKNKCRMMTLGFGLLPRRERRAYPHGSVRSEQRRQRAKEQVRM